jgi:hypothetical protein
MSCVTQKRPPRSPAQTDVAAPHGHSARARFVRSKALSRTEEKRNRPIDTTRRVEARLADAARGIPVTIEGLAKIVGPCG